MKLIADWRVTAAQERTSSHYREESDSEAGQVDGNIRDRNKADPSHHQTNAPHNRRRKVSAVQKSLHRTYERDIA